MAEPSTDHSGFLKLPPELRNRIYEMVLVEEDFIHVTRQPSFEPPLLKTCHQIRDDALQIYFEMNAFVFYAPAFDSTAIMRWTAKVRRMGEGMRAIAAHWQSVFDDMPDWSNLMLWLRRYHAGEAESGIDDDNPSPDQEDKILVMMFGMVEDLADLRWPQVERILERSRFLLARCDSAWYDGMKAT
ncbi:hypothetical protein LTR85_006884 [Meristemomyces frigidus]|nr:hypothetical protein LTR85_006884 [Meristemomyces frigidus]